MKAANEEKLIYEWIVLDDYKRTPHEDIAKAYRVYACQDAMSGIIVYALWNNDKVWEANPPSTRPLIKHLIGEID